MWHSRPPRDPPPFLAKTTLNFHFEYPQPSLRMTWLTLCPQTQVRSEGLLDTMTCLMDHLAERQEEEANFNFIEEKIAQPLIDLGVDITFEHVAPL